MRGGRPDVGVGSQITPEQLAAMKPVPLVYGSFTGGLNTSDSPEDVELNQAIYAIDMDVDRSDSLVPAPGFLTFYQGINTGAPYAFQQAGLDGSAELVLINGLAGGPGSNSWQYVHGGVLHGPYTGLNNTLHWTALSVAGTLLISDGSSQTVTRALGATTLTDITATQIIAATGFALQFGRVFGVGVTPLAGSYQALGISWNGSSGDPADWTGLGSGSQLLIGAEQEADFCLAAAPLGFDLLIIVNRRSVWAGYPTGQANNPADLRPLAFGVGTPFKNTVAATPRGVIFLSDEGVMLATQSGIECISQEINATLLPLNLATGQVEPYVAMFSPYRNRYVLKTPTGIFIYTMPVLATEYSTGSSSAGRWTQRSALVDWVVEWTDTTLLGQAASTLWALKNSFPNTLVGIEAFAGNATPSYFGTAYTPTWRTPSPLKGVISEQYTTVGFELEYFSTQQVTIKLQLANSAGQPVGSSTTKVLPSTGGLLSRVKIYNLTAGLGTSLQIQYTSFANGLGFTQQPYCNITRIVQLVRPVGPMITSL